MISFMFKFAEKSFPAEESIPTFRMIITLSKLICSRSYNFVLACSEVCRLFKPRTCDVVECL